MSFFYFLNSDLNEKYGPVRLLTSADDLNNITNNGTYWYWTDSVPANAPYNNAAVVEVSGSESSTNQKIQRVTRYGVSGQSAFRALDTAGWKEWAAYLTNADIQIYNLITPVTNGSNIVTGTVPGLKVGKACLATVSTTTSNYILCAAATAENTIQVRFANNFSGSSNIRISVVFEP